MGNLSFTTQFNYFWFLISLAEKLYRENVKTWFITNETLQTRVLLIWDAQGYLCARSGILVSWSNPSATRILRLIWDALLDSVTVFSKNLITETLLCHVATNEMHFLSKCYKRDDQIPVDAMNQRLLIISSQSHQRDAPTLNCSNDTLPKFKSYKRDTSNSTSYKQDAPTLKCHNFELDGVDFSGLHARLSQGCRGHMVLRAAMSRRTARLQVMIIAIIYCMIASAWWGGVRGQM